MKYQTDCALTNTLLNNFYLLYLPARCKPLARFSGYRTKARRSASRYRDARQLPPDSRAIFVPLFWRNAKFSEGVLQPQKRTTALTCGFAEGNEAFRQRAQKDFAYRQFFAMNSSHADQGRCNYFEFCTVSAIFRRRGAFFQLLYDFSERIRNLKNGQAL